MLLRVFPLTESITSPDCNPLCRKYGELETLPTLKPPDFVSLSPILLIISCGFSLNSFSNAGSAEDSVAGACASMVSKMSVKGACFPASDEITSCSFLVWLIVSLAFWF